MQRWTMALLIGRVSKQSRQSVARLSQLIQQERCQTNAAYAQEKETGISEWESARPFSEVPSGGWRVWRDFLPGGKYSKINFNEVFELMRLEYGEISYMPGLFGKPGMIITHSPEDHEKVFRNEGIWPERPGASAIEYHRNKYRADFFQDVEGLISTKDEKWGTFRTVVNPILMQPKNVRRYFKKMADVNLELVRRIRQIRDPSTLEVPGTFEDELNRWTLESVSVVALDKQLGLLIENRNDPKAAELFKQMSVFFEISFELEVGASPWRYIPTPNFKKVMKALDVVQQITANYVNEAIERLDNERKQGKVRLDNEKSVLEKLLAVDKKIAMVMAMDMLMAGVDTTTSTFTALLLALAKNPDKQEILRQEVLDFLPDKDGEFNESKVQNIPYLRACIKESQRIYPLVFGNIRVVKKDVVLSGYQVPKETNVMMPSINLLRNSKYFSRPNEYLPERWLRNSDQPELKLTNPFVFLPFGFGPRSCIGKRIVEMEMELGIARLLRNFRIEFNYPTENAFRAALINVPNIPLKFKFIDLPK